MVKGVGTDLVRIERIEQVLSRYGDRFIERILTPLEQQVFAQKHTAAWLAKRFAAKEAAAKAIATGIAQGVTFQDFEITNDAQGAPSLVIKNIALERMQALGAQNAHLSLSDEKDYALAFVVLD